MTMTNPQPTKGRGGERKAKCCKKTEREIGKKIKKCFDRVNFTKHRFFFNGEKMKVDSGETEFYEYGEIGKGIDKLNLLLKKLHENTCDIKHGKNPPLDDEIIEEFEKEFSLVKDGKRLTYGLLDRDRVRVFLIKALTRAREDERGKVECKHKCHYASPDCDECKKTK